MIAPIFKATVKRQKLYLEKDELFRKFLIGLEGTDVELTVKRPKSQRSLNQNSYYWGVIIEIISQETGQDRETIHNLLKAEFLSKLVVINGREYKITKSTTDLSTVEFNEYSEQCRQWASMELGLYIPEPNEVEW